MTVKSIILAIFLANILLIVVGVNYGYFNTNVESNWRYSTEFERGWNEFEFNDSNWVKHDLPGTFKNDSKDIYIRGIVRNSEHHSYNEYLIIADDCIKNIFIDGVEIFQNKQCSKCMHCGGFEVDLQSHLTDGRNLVSIQMEKEVGPGYFYFGNEKNIIKWHSRILLISILIISLIGYRFIKKLWFAFILFTLIALLFTHHMFINFDFLAGGDWDFNIFYFSVGMDSILQHHQIPFWNPYSCGGEVYLASPQRVLPTPLYALALPFQVAHAIKLIVLMYMIAGLIGSYMLARHFNFSNSALILCPLIFLCSGVFIQHIKEGHLNWTTMCWLPWIFLFYLKSIKDLRYGVLAAVPLAFTLYEGYPYTFAYALLLIIPYSIFESVRLSFTKKDIRPILSVGVLIIVVSAFSAAKLVPMVEFALDNPRLTNDDSGFTPGLLIHSILDRNQGFRYNLPDLKWGWHEYGGYIGILPLLLGLYGCLKNFKKYWPLILVGLFFLMLSFNTFSPINLWVLIRQLPLFMSLRNPTRMIIMGMFILSIFAGKGLTKIERKDRLLAYLILFIVFLDLMLVNGVMMKDTFTVAPYEIAKGEFSQAISGSDKSGGRNTMYPLYLENKGTMDCYRAFDQPNNASALSYPDYQGEAYLLGGGKAVITKFTPNEIQVDVGANQGDTLVLNQNFNPGWTSDTGAVRSYNGLISVDIPNGSHEITLYYKSNAFNLGLIITALSILAAALILIKSREKD